MKNFILTSVILSFALSISTGAQATDAPLSSEAQSTPSGGLAELFNQEQKSKFLPVYQAFKVTISQKDDKLLVSFKVTPEHYIYRDKLAITLPDGVVATPWQFSITPNTVNDPTFGQVAVFERNFTATTRLSSQTRIDDAPIVIKWQGCATAGLCYPPEKTKSTISLMAKSASGAQNVKVTQAKTSGTTKDTNHTTTQSTTASSISEKPNTPTSTKDDDRKSEGVNDSPLVEVLSDTIPSQDINTSQVASILSDGATSDVVNEMMDDSQMLVGQNGVLTTTATSDSDNDRHKITQEDSDPFGIQKKPLTALFLLFLAGLLLSFTPCVYPMIPIVANIVARQEGVGSTRGFALSASYGIGVATAYGVLGAVVAWFGRALGITGWLQNPYVLVIFAIIFAVLAMAMFDLVQLRLPTTISSRLQSRSQMSDGYLGSIGGSFIAGGLSALVVSPCVSLPMAGALTAVSVSGSVWVGFFALFLFGLGLSLPLMLLGAVQARFMPQAGVWMNRVKEFCGLLLLAVAVSLIERVWLSPAMLVLWAGWFMLFAVWCFRLGKMLAQAVSAVAGIWAVCLIVGAAMGGHDVWRPLASLQGSTIQAQSTTNPDIKVTTLAELDAVLAHHNKVLVDVTAEWCIECRIMERTLFTNRPAMLNGYQVVKLDITESTDDSRAVLERYQLFGPPALLFYKDKQLQHVLLGEVKRDSFEQILTSL